MSWPRLVGVALCGMVASACTETVESADPDGGAGGTTTSGGGEMAGGAGGTDMVPCDGERGTFSGQTLAFEGEERFFALHVPESYDCMSAHPVLMDFHGSYGGAVAEEAYAHQDLIDLASELGFILVRPRARPSVSHQWDASPGDLRLNRRFASALLDDLATRYNIDTERRYASGYSSGANMAASFLLDEGNPFSGLAVLSGALWNAAPLGGKSWEDPPRVYINTGFRDLHWIYTGPMLAALAAYPAEQLWERETDAGHVLDLWSYRELYAFFEAGERPESGSLSSAWVAQSSPTDVTLLELDVTSTGDLWLGDEAGTIWHDDGSGWNPTFTASPPRPIGALDMHDDGGIAAMLDDIVIHQPDWQRPALPASSDGFAFLMAAAGAGDDWLAAGTTGYLSEDGATTFAEISTQAAYTVQAMAQGASGTTVAVGAYAHISRRPSGGTFARINIALADRWLHAVAASPNAFWAAGEGGAILRSHDDGSSFELVPSGTTEDLYAIAFFDDERGAAAGVRGEVVVTVDGGATWEPRPTGLDALVADLAWRDSATLIAVGEDGLLLHSTID